MNHLNLPENKLSHHILICGDTGTGKTQAIKQFAYYAATRGDSVVFLDSKREFTPEFFHPRRGDKILDPTDTRCVYWHIGNEVTDEVDAVSVARAAYPHNPSNPQAEFWDNTARDVMASLLARYRPTCADLANWLIVPQTELFPRLKGTEHFNTLVKAMAGQKSAILGTMNQLGRSLRMMPLESEDREYFTVRDWCEHRKGWLFLPNSQDTREALRPVLTMLIDLFFLRLMSMGSRPDLPRVWLILDEIASLNTLPQLHGAITEMRAAGHPIVIGIQNLADLEYNYGRKSDTIVSQSYTKLILATSEARSRQLLSDMIGEQERERWEIAQSHDRLNRRDSYNLRTYERKTILPSEIGKLKDLEAYLLQRGEVTKIKLPYLAPIQRSPRHIRRVLPQTQAVPLKAVANG